MADRIALGIIVGALCFARGAHADEPPTPPPPPPPADPPVVVLPAYSAPPAAAQPLPPQLPLTEAPEEITEIEDGRPVPPGYTAVQHRRKGFIIAGAITLGASYLVAAEVAAISQQGLVDAGTSKHNILLLPFAGPFLDLKNTTSATGRLFLVGLGAAEITGAVLFVFGLTHTKTIFIRNDLVGLTITPTGVSGRF